MSRLLAKIFNYHWPAKAANMVYYQNRLLMGAMAKPRWLFFEAGVIFANDQELLALGLKIG